MQEEIATSVAGELGVRLGVGGINAFRGAGTQNVEAYEAYLQSQNGDLSRQEVMRLVERAIELDPNYAAAWSFLGHKTLGMNWDASPEEASEILDLAYSHALHGIELNPESATGQRTLAMLRGAQLDWIGAEEGFRRAIELLADRSIVTTYGGVLLRNGRTAEAQKQWRIAVSLEPMGGRPVNMAWHASLTQGRFKDC
jgi:Tfp pilus assembly protein PilF